MKIILALYPNTRGFGYACLQISNDKPAQKLLDSGIINVRPINNQKVLKHIKKFAEYFKPALVVLRDYHRPTKRGKRISELLGSITDVAKQYDLPLYRYTREQVRFAFEQHGAFTKYEIAQKLIEGFPELASRAPRIRKPWQEEDYRMGVFDALALAITHHYLS